MGITLLKHEPSAQIPWANTMLGLVEVRCDANMLITVLLFHCLSSSAALPSLMPELSPRVAEMAFCLLHAL